MPITDFVADFLTVVRNAGNAKKEKVTVPTSKLTSRIAEILKEEGFVENIKPFTDNNKKFLRLHLKLIGGKHPAIKGLRRISKPGLRAYVDCRHLPKVQGGLGIAIISTSKGILSDKQARQQKVGGEILCKVW